MPDVLLWARLQPPLAADQVCSLRAEKREMGSAPFCLWGSGDGPSKATHKGTLELRRQLGTGKRRELEDTRTQKLRASAPEGSSAGMKCILWSGFYNGEAGASRR